MQLHLHEISRHVSPGAYAALTLDRAGWHVTGKLRVPSNITLLPLSAAAPELNPVENVRQYLRDNWFSNQVFESEVEIVEVSAQAWRNLRARPETVKSIGYREWAHGF